MQTESLAPTAQTVPPTTNGGREHGLRVCIVAEHASRKFGGEAILPWHYFRRLRLRGIEAWLVVHERTRAELSNDFGADLDRIQFVSDSLLQRGLWRIGQRFPREFRPFTTGLLIRFLTAVRARRRVRSLVRTHAINIVHEPIPVSPRNPSMMFGVGAPVVIGPLNGNMQHPPGFRHRQRERRLARLARPMSQFLNRLLPGKLQADTVLVANERTRQGLPRGVRGAVMTMSENGVDLALWQARAAPEARSMRFVFLGFLVRVKAVDLLLRAFAQAGLQAGTALDIVGDGPERPALERLAGELGIAGQVVFHGFRSQAEAAQIMSRAEVFVFTSLQDCGGAAVLEALACGLPCIATNWGGPADYLDPSCALLIDPTDEPRFLSGFATALKQLESDDALRARLAAGARRRIQDRGFDWEGKIDRMLEVYQSARQRALAAAGRGRA